MASKRKKTKRGKKIKPNGVNTASPLTVLAERWLQVSGRFNVQAQASLDWWSLICASYLDARRSCHNFHFLESLLTQLGIAEKVVGDTTAILFALFFHAIIIDAAATNNEERSAECFSRYCRDSGGIFPEDVEARVIALILMCKANGAACRDASSDEVKLFVDMRLAVLGAEKERYTDHLRQLRREFAHLPHDLYCKKRTAELKQLLSRPYLFKSMVFRELYEQRARENIRYEMTVIAAPQVSSSRLTVSDVSDVTQFVTAHSRVVGEGGRNLDNPLAVNTEAVLHAIAMSMELTLAYRDAKRELICVVLCTRSDANSYNLQSRLEHCITGQTALLHTVVTHRDHRGRGLATSLVLELLSALRDQGGVKSVCAFAWRGSRQVDFLKKQGFAETGDVVDFRDVPLTTAHHANDGEDPNEVSDDDDDDEDHDDEETAVPSGPGAVAESLQGDIPSALATKVGQQLSAVPSVAAVSSLDASWARALDPLVREALHMRLVL